jgi:hypothetical protein
MHAPAIANQDGPGNAGEIEERSEIPDARRSEVLFMNRKRQIQMTSAGRNRQAARPLLRRAPALFAAVSGQSSSDARPCVLSARKVLKSTYFIYG